MKLGSDKTFRQNRNLRNYKKTKNYGSGTMTKRESENKVLIKRKLCISSIKKLHVLFCTIFLTLSVTTASACPIACNCIWKSGKQTVECENKNLNTLPDGISAETQVLNISGNRLEFLPRNTFQRAGLLNLQRIYLRNSKIRQIDSLAFNELINLVEIDLSDNLLSSVPSNAFKSTPFLRELNLGGNPLVQIPSGAFEFLTQLVKLDLSRAQLIFIDDFAFSSLRILESLKLTSNQLSTLTNLTVSSLSSVRVIELHGNPWNCECRLRDLRVWLENKRISVPISPTCRTPSRLAGRRFNEIESSEFACAPSIIGDVERHVQVYEGQNATMHCSATSPLLSIQWFSQRRLITNNMAISSNRYFIITQEIERGRSSLSLINALEKDSGEFVCVVENSAGLSEANFTLSVLPQSQIFNLNTSDTSTIVLIIIGILLFLFIILFGVIFAIWRRRRSRENSNKREVLASSTPIKPPRLPYENGSDSSRHNYSKNKGEPSENPDLILETNNSSYHENGLEESSNNSELNWEQQSYRNLGYSTEYPPDYGLPIIHENSIYSESVSYYGGVIPNGVQMSGTSAVLNKNKVGSRILRAPSSRDSPDEGYQEGYCGTDV